MQEKMQKNKTKSQGDSNIQIGRNLFSMQWLQIQSFF